MGLSFSQNKVEQTLDNLTTITSNAVANSAIDPSQVQRVDCIAGRDVNISNVSFEQSQVVNMTQALTSLNDADATQASQAQLTQLAQALTKGINFGNVSVASNLANQMLSNTINIANDLNAACTAANTQFQTINGEAGRDCIVTYVDFKQSQNIMSECVATMKNKNKTLQEAKAVADQTAIAKTEGLDIMGWLMLGLIIILVLPIVLISVKGKNGGGGGGASKAGTVILGFLGGGLLLSGIIMAAVGDKETITLYGYVNQADFATCGTAAGPVITNVKEVGEGGASTKCLRMNEENPGSCDGFFFDETSKTMQVYTDVKNKPCDGMTNLMENPDANAGKKWAGFVQTPHKIRNIGLGLIGGGALCIIILVVFMFMKKKGEAAVPTQ